MREFPLFTAIYNGAVQLLRYRMVLLALLIAVELLPLLFGPYLLFLRSVNRWDERLIYWLHPWACSQTVILASACVALPGRWHVRVFFALLALAWVWGAYMTGIQSCFWPASWIGPLINDLASRLVWLFAISGFLASLLLSLCGLELRWEPVFPRRGGTGRWQFSLGFLMTAMCVVALTLLVVRALFRTPPEWVSFNVIMEIRWQHFVQLGFWGLIGSLSMVAAVSSRWHWLWLIGLVTMGVTVSPFFETFFRSPVGRGFWMPLAMTVHPFLIASIWSKLGVQLPRITQLDPLHRALASVR